MTGEHDSLTRRDLLARAAGAGALANFAPALVSRPIQPRAKRIIYLFQSGGPSQMDTFDYKPILDARHGEQLPDSIRRGQRLTGMSGNQTSIPVARSPFEFRQHGQCGAWVSSLLPNTAKVVDELTIIRSMHTNAINHDPAITFFQTGSEVAGRPSLPAWLSFGLGSGNPNLPASVVLVTKNKGGQPLYARLWGAGFLPSRHQGVQLRAGADPVLYLSNPKGVTRAMRRDVLDDLRALHELQLEREGDPEIASRIAQYEMAYRMQESVPDVVDFSDEPDEVFTLYGEDARNPGTFAANCLLARRLIERDVRFVQLFHQGWDQHGSLKGGISRQCKETDRASAALVCDLKRRGLLDDTIVVWGGEFGRTAYSQGKLTPNGFGRDHHPRCFSMWMAGGGFRQGLVYGETDDFSYNIVDKPASVHDLHATLLYLLGIDHEQLVFKHQGRRYRLTDVHGEVMHAWLA